MRPVWTGHDAHLTCDPPSAGQSGASDISGLETRFTSELAELAPASMRPAVVTPPEYMPTNTLKTSVWSGGAILAKVRLLAMQMLAQAG